MMMGEPDVTEPNVDRRPLPVRRWSIWIPAARRLAALGATPNGISGLGLAFGAAAGAALFATARADAAWGARTFWLLSALLIQLRAMCNLLDGVVAVETCRMSRVGELYNEVPDRISDAAMLVGAGFAAGGSPVWGFAAAILAVFVAYIRALTKATGAPQDYCGPMAKPMRMQLVSLAALYMMVAPTSAYLHWGPDQRFGVMAIALMIIVAGCIITAARRLVRAARHLKAGAP